MAELDDLISNVATEAIINREHCEGVLLELAERNDARDFEARRRSNELAREKSDADSAVARLYRMVETGMADLDDPEFVARFKRVKDERDIIAAKLDRLAVLKSERISVTPDQLNEFAEFLSARITTGPMTFRKSYLRAFIDEVRVDGDRIEIIPRFEAA